MLGVDCINMSLGADSGPLYVEGFTEVLEAAYEAGVNVMVSAGNQGYSGLDSLWGDGMVKSDSVSTGTLGSPGTFDSVLTVASMENSEYVNFEDNVITWYDESMETRLNLHYYELDAFSVEIPDGMGFRERLAGRSFGFTDSFEGAAGKLVFISFAGGDADTLAQQAQDANAAGLLLVLPKGVDEPELTLTKFDVPVAVTDQGEYAFMKYYVPEGEEIRVDDNWNPSDMAGEMSEFSAWGPTEGLALKPEIAGIGGNVLSAWYGTYVACASGTSMSAPAVSACAALLRQYLTKEGLVDENELAHAVNCLLMSTATPIRDEENNTLYFVRRQGAGLANIGNAIASNAYIQVEGTNKAKLELGDDPDKTGKYEMTFEVVNLSDTPKTYTLSTTVLGQKADGGLLKHGKVTYLTYDYARELEAFVTSNLTDGTLTVPGNGTATVTVTVALSDADKSYYNERFPAGAYVEGFVQLLSEDTPNLSVPFLAFYGDFSDGPIIESGYESLLGGTHSYNMADQFHSALWSLHPVNETLWTKEMHYLGDTHDPGYCMIPERDFKPAMSTWAKEFYPTTAGISPNGDGVLDLFYYGIGLRRNVSSITYTVTDRENGEVIWKQDNTGFACKTFKASVYAGAELSWDWLYPKVEMDGGYWEYDTSKCLLANNTWVDITVTVTLDGEESVTESQTFSMYIDTEAPMSWEDYTFFVRTQRDEVQLPIPGMPPIVIENTIYSFESMIREQWFMDYMVDFALQYDPDAEEWTGFTITTSWSGYETPSGGRVVESVLGTTTFDENTKRMSLCYDYAGNVSAWEIRGCADLLEYVELDPASAVIQPGESLTIENVAEVPYHARLNWSVSDETIAEIVETTDNSITIKGLQNGKVTISGGFGNQMEDVEVVVGDDAYLAAMEKAQAIMDLIDALPSPYEVTAEDAEAIAAARAAYEALTEEEKALVENLGKLKACEAALEALRTDPENPDPEDPTPVYPSEPIPVPQPSVTVEMLPFSDVKDSDWYKEYVAYVYHRGIMNGLSGTKFGPEETLTRAQLVTALYRLAGEPGVGAPSGFTDVPSSQYYADAVSWAKENGIVNGISASAFGPDTAVTREQAATILYRYVTDYLGMSGKETTDLSIYTDEKQIAGYAEEAVSWASAAGMFGGYPDNSFRPTTTLTRSQLAKLLTVLDRDF